MGRACLTRFHQTLSDVEETRSKMESLLASGHIDHRDIKVVYEAMFIRAVSGFEQFCEELFFSIVSRKAKYPKTRKIEMRVKTDLQNVRDLMSKRDGDKSYFEWLPFSRTESRAKLFLKDGRPFTEVTDGVRSTISNVVIIRNAIAHASDHAATKFAAMIANLTVLTPEERTPAGFLRSKYRDTPPQNRFQGYVGDLGGIALSLC